MFFFSSLGTKLAHKLGLTPPRPTEREVFPIDLKILPLFWTNYQLWYLKVRRCEPFTSQIIGELSKRIQFKSLGNNPKESSMIKCQNQGGAGGSPGAQPSSGWRADQVSKLIGFLLKKWSVSLHEIGHAWQIKLPHFRSTLFNLNLGDNPQKQFVKETDLPKLEQNQRHMLM